MNNHDRTARRALAKHSYSRPYLLDLDRTTEATSIKRPGVFANRWSRHRRAALIWIAHGFGVHPRNAHQGGYLSGGFVGWTPNELSSFAGGKRALANVSMNALLCRSSVRIFGSSMRCRAMMLVKIKEAYRPDD
jgi:hypothetical protein